MIKIMRVLLILNSIYLMIIGDFLNVVVLASGIVLSFIPWMMERFLNIKLTDAIIDFSMVFVLCSQWLGTYMRAYDYINWWDVMLHGLSGVLISLVGIILVLLLDRKSYVLKNKLYGLLCMIMFLTGSASAVFWEIFEYIGDTFFGTFAQLGSLTDTMEDMVICVLVSGVFSLIVYIQLKREKHGFFVKQIDELLIMNTHDGKGIIKK
ncbi:MAG: hypothetical protein ACRCSG_03065 [Cellulosilyticaceae bacterium]